MDPRGPETGSFAAGVRVEICSSRDKYGGLFPVKKKGGREVFLAELDGSKGKVLFPNAGGGLVVDVITGAGYRTGRTTLPKEVLIRAKKEDK